jgi:hypothetical protein
MRPKKKIIVLSTISTITLVCGIYGYYCFAACMAFLFLMVIYNNILQNKIRKQKKPFGPYSEIRNVDCLVIGDMISASSVVPSGCKYIQISAPGRSLKSSFEILKHTSSILKEDGGEVYLIVDIKNKNNGFSVFDIPFFHSVTIRKYNLYNLEKKTRYRILFAPIKSLRYVLGVTKNVKNKENKAEDGLYADIRNFCRVRNIKLCVIELKNDYNNAIKNELYAKNGC